MCRILLILLPTVLLVSKSALYGLGAVSAGAVTCSDVSIPRMSFSGKVVLVVGGTGGIGAAIATQFAKEGAHVVISGRDDERLNKVSEECKKFGNSAFEINADLTKDDDVTMIIDQTVKKFGKLDVLVYSAGILERGSVLDGTLLEGYDKVMSVNLRAAVKITNVAAPHLIQTKGNIIYISSIYSKGVPPSSEFIPTSVSKAGLDHFMRCVALELAPLGVRANTVNPGPVVTDILLKSGFGRALSIDDYKKLTPLGRITDPQEVADLVLFLASDTARSITGSVYDINNGLLLKQ